MTKNGELKAGVPIVRVFKARARVGQEQASPTVVNGKAGFLGYVAGGPAQPDSRDFFFISMWRDFLALKEVFGGSWRESHLPPGYAETHYELTDQVGT